MKGLLLLAVLGVLGYYGYKHFSAKPEPGPPVPAQVVEPKPEPVNFAVRSRVGRLFKEWKRRSLAGGKSQLDSATVDTVSELTDIRETLFREGAHSEAAVLDVIKRALRELGVAEKEINEVAAGIVGMR